MSEIAKKVIAIVVDKLGVEESQVTPEASFTGDLGADSLDTIELIMEIEKDRKKAKINKYLDFAREVNKHQNIMELWEAQE